MKRSFAAAIIALTAFCVLLSTTPSHAKRISPMDIYNELRRTFTATHKQWKKGPTVTVVHGDLIDITTYYAKGNVVQGCFYGSEFDLFYARSSKFDGIITGLKAGMTKDEVRSVLGNPQKTVGSELRYSLSSDAPYASLNLHFNKQGKLDGFLLDTGPDMRTDYIRKLEDLRRYDSNAPEISKK